ncbi:MAG: response regulator transcription factor [Anaerolineales bacterium]|nr:response regulator transcription factor [Anaerolineales bacterium]
MQDIRLVFATPDADTLGVLHSMLRAAQQLTCPTVTTVDIESTPALHARIESRSDDVVLLDWALAEEATSELVHKILSLNPQLRVVVLLPLDMRQYRQQVWDAGACNSIPKEYMDQEWLASILCVMYRAMQREARLRASLLRGSAESISTTTVSPI